MRNFEEAKKSLSRVTFNDEQRGRSKAAWEKAENFLRFLWETAEPSAELVQATRAVELSLMWHSKAIANENK